jgi:serine/threonine protein kinase
MPLTAGTRLGTCEIGEIGELVGAGGMGEVYRARDKAPGREVAVKVLPAGFAADAERLRRFGQEAQAAAALNHPNILTIYHVGEQDSAPYIVSELLEDETLRERLRAGPPPVRKAVEYAVHVASGLASAHDKGIVHRDLKPENLFLSREERVKILDFGLAKLTEPAGGAAGSELATRRGGNGGRDGARDGRLTNRVSRRAPMPGSGRLGASRERASQRSPRPALPRLAIERLVRVDRSHDAAARAAPGSRGSKVASLLDAIPTMDTAARTSVDPLLMWMTSTCILHDRLGVS